MGTGTAMAKAQIVDEPDVWREFQRALAHRWFIRALALARKLPIDESQIRVLQRDVLNQFLGEYQDADGANRLWAEYGLTVDELTIMMNELLGGEESGRQTTSSCQTRKTVYVSVATRFRRITHLLHKKIRQTPLLSARSKVCERFHRTRQNEV